MTFTAIRLRICKATIFLQLCTLAQSIVSDCDCCTDLILLQMKLVTVLKAV